MILRRPARFFLLTFAVALLLAAAEHGTRALYLPWRGPQVHGWWIWAAEAARTAEPVAFFAVRDFDLAAAAPGSISIAADEGYDLYLNGRPVGAGSYRAGMAIDRYRVGDLLRAGRNRITIGLSSGRGAGGLLAAVEVEGRTVVATGGDWQVFRRQSPALFDTDAPLAGGEAPKVWQRPPTGRWRPRPPQKDRSLPFLRRGPAPNRFPIRVRIFHPGTPWNAVNRRQLRLPVSHPLLLLDWGREVTGFLAFGLGTADAAPALAFFGSEPPDPEDRPADEVMIFAPGQTAWRDAHARRFRYVLLVGTEDLLRVRVWEVNPETAAELAPPREPAGVFGIEPPALRSAAERRVWEQLWL